jgi:hypothetical protein
MRLLAISGAILLTTFSQHTLDANRNSWSVELEQPGHITSVHGVLDIDVPAGATLWWKKELRGPVEIQYEALAVSESGANDRVSDLNCFWMAADALVKRRSGKFADYDDLRAYYVGLGGNSNTTTRFRRYIGTPGNRPLLPEHDLQAPEFLLRANVWQTIRLVADGSTIQYYRDGKPIFDFHDPAPYTRGYFGIRTTQSHIRVRNFGIATLHSTR